MTEAFRGLTGRQRRVVVAAWLTYAAYYLGRVNISSAIPSLEDDLGLSKGQVGWFLTGFFVIYAFSTLVNGRLGDRLSPRKFVFVGLLGTAAINLLFGLSSTWTLLLLIWCLNGYFQATGWGPILRTVANWLTAEQSSRLSSAFGASFVFGNAVTWLLAGWCVSQFGWRWAFYLPSALLLAAATGWWFTVRDQPKPSVDKPESEREPLLRGLTSSLLRYWPLSLSSLLVGTVFGVFTLWSPTYFVEAGGLSPGNGSSLASLIPMAGIVGIISTGWLTSKYFVGREMYMIGGVLAVMGLICAVYAFVSFYLITSVILMMLIAALTYSATSLLLATMPLVLDTVETSSTAGLFDFSFAIGTSLSGVATGLILDSFGWQGVFIALAAATWLAVMLIFLSMVGESKAL